MIGREFDNRNLLEPIDIVIEVAKSRFFLYTNGFLSEKYNKILKKRINGYIKKHKIIIDIEKLTKYQQNETT